MPDVNVNSLVYTVIVGLIAGWLAGLIVKGGGFGIIGNIIIGIIGAIIGFYLFRALHISIPVGNAIVNDIITAAIGAIVLLFLLSFVRT
jgi:uncharacterized membrane protein YeaQ/YmgE (transglycosylase-associated protein family)